MPRFWRYLLLKLIHGDAAGADDDNAAADDDDEYEGDIKRKDTAVDATGASDNYVNDAMMMMIIQMIQWW